MPITKPVLKPKAGYVERVGANGKHYYEPTKETSAMQQIFTDTDAMLVDYEYRITLLELGLTE